MIVRREDQITRVKQVMTGGTGNFEEWLCPTSEPELDEFSAKIVDALIDQESMAGSLRGEPERGRDVRKLIALLIEEDPQSVKEALIELELAEGEAGKARK